MHPPDDSFTAEILTCEDLANIGVWKFKDCCKDCHQKMIVSDAFGQMLMNSEGDAFTPSPDGFFAIRCCHTAHERMNYKLNRRFLRTVFEVWRLNRELVFDLFQDVIDQGETIDKTGSGGVRKAP